MRIHYILVIGLLLLSRNGIAQRVIKPVRNWQLLDLKSDGVLGISLLRAENELLKEKAPVVVTVAIIDGGVDITHRDLKPVIWTDGQGLHGWNFNGTMKQGDPEFDLRSLAILAVKDTNARKLMEEKLAPEKAKLRVLKQNQQALAGMLAKLGKSDPTGNDFREYVPVNTYEQQMQMLAVQGLKSYPDFIPVKQFEMKRDIAALEIELAFQEAQDFDLVTGGPTAHHGTHVAGIIAAQGEKSTGIKGVAPNARIMVLRAVPGYRPGEDSGRKMVVGRMPEQPGSESFKQIALAIRYAADHGAKVINMSFGNDWKTEFSDLNEAVKYAAAKDVLIVHAAGNFGIDLDKAESFPNRKTVSGLELAASWIEVAASGPSDDGQLAASFSNYGKTKVDVYAPGVDIASTAPRNTYWTDSGTSMAAPVVAGLAALIRGYFPLLSARQVKEIIMRSVSRRGVLADKCVSSGVVNAYEALKLAAQFK